MKVRSFLFVLLALAALPVCAQTILVYVEDTADGQTTPGRAAVRAGVYNALFEAGYVFFDPGERAVTDVDWASGSSTELRDAAIDGDAHYLLVATARTVTTRRDGGRPLVETVVRVHVLRLTGFTARNLETQVLRSSNTGREDSVDTEALGGETGALVVGVLDHALAANSSGSR